MGEWALPADEALAFARAVKEAKAAGRPEARWLRGAIWRNFQVKYREVNDLHKQMLRVSDLVEAMPRGSGRDTARDHLYAGQSNDPLLARPVRRDLPARPPGGRAPPPHRRRGSGARRARSGPASPACSSTSTSTGATRRFSSDDGQIVAVKLDQGAGIGRWDLRAAGHPLAAVMRRRPEAYHEKVREHDRAGQAPSREPQTRRPMAGWPPSTTSSW